MVHGTVSASTAFSFTTVVLVLVSLTVVKMNLALVLFIFLVPLNTVQPRTDSESIHMLFTNVGSKLTRVFPAANLKSLGPCQSFYVYKPLNLLHLHCLSILKDWFNVSTNSFSTFTVSLNSKYDICLKSVSNQVSLES